MPDIIPLPQGLHPRGYCVRCKWHHTVMSRDDPSFVAAWPDDTPLPSLHWCRHGEQRDAVTGQIIVRLASGQRAHAQACGPSGLNFEEGEGT